MSLSACCALLWLCTASPGWANRPEPPRRLGIDSLTRPLPPDRDACGFAIQAAETAYRIPPRLLNAIGMVESARTDPQTRHAVPWPWTINIAGVGTFFDSKADAIAAVRKAMAARIRSIDVGCAQINLMHHPDAFASLDEAFDPSANARYAALFLRRLHLATNDWSASVANYHSMTPDIGADYVKRVALYWPAVLPAGRLAGRTAAADLIAQIDPMHVMTPEFRSRLIRDAAERAARDARLGRPPAEPLPKAGLSAIARQLSSRTAMPGLAAPRPNAPL